MALFRGAVGGRVRVRGDGRALRPRLCWQSARDAMAAFDVEPEYLALVDPATLEPIERLERPALLAVAARVGETRLIDN